MKLLFIPLLATFFIMCSPIHAENVSVSSLDLEKMQQDYERPSANLSIDRRPLTLGGKKFSDGIGTHANSTLLIKLQKAATHFSATVGLDDEVKNTRGSVEFLLKGDGKTLWRSGVMKANDVPKEVNVDLHGIANFALLVTDAGDGHKSDHADWAGARIEYAGTKPFTMAVPSPILTPKSAPQPRINGPSVFGARAGNPFLYTVPATGTRPMTFAADGLPADLKLDVTTGRITGTAPVKGEYVVTLSAKNDLGTGSKKFRLVIGDEIALTPPLGWNSYNCWGGDVDADKVMRSARALIAFGLDQHGWTYVNIDDTWQGGRGGPLLALQPDPHRFPDMKKLCDDVHALGLKAGIYSTPWTVSYGNRLGGSAQTPDGKWDASTDLKAAKNKHIFPFDVGQYHFAKNDAKQFAEWGFDYLKYDWGPVDVANTQEMGEALQATGRDVVYSLSNNAAGNIHGIIAELAPHANAWRTTSDINDSWGSMSGIGFHQDKWAPFQKPGHYNDPDMLVVGAVGWGHPHPTKLTPDEQYTHLSLWCLLGAPLLIGCDLERLDDFTLSLLTNDEVLEIDQDALCQQAIRVASANDLDVYAKPLSDGSIAVGLFNRSSEEATVAAQWTDLKLNGRQQVRDLWRQKDLGTFDQNFEAEVASHGVVFVRIFPAP